MRAPILFCAAAVCAICTMITARAADWMQFGYDASHSGNNTAETTITAANVAQMQRRYQASLPAALDGAPVYLSNVSTPQGTKDLLFVFANNTGYNCSSTGYLVALDAADGSQAWSKTTTGCQPATASPAIDPNRQYVYSYGLDGYVHKYEVGDGTEVTSGGWPELATLKTNVEKGASSLTIATSGADTYLYVVNDGYIGDGGDYQGHITTINLGTGAQNVFNVMCSDMSIHFVNNGTPGIDDCASRQSGIWGRPGATFDPGTGHVYIATGNGTFDANNGGYNWGDSVLALGANGLGNGALPLDSYTPTTYQNLQDTDKDLGSVSLAILPVPSGEAITNLGVQLGKDAMIRLINLDNMSGSGLAGAVGGELQLISVPQGGSWMRAQPAVWVDTAGDGATWLLVANNSGESGLKVTYNNLDLPELHSQWQRGGTATSAIVANGILFYAASCSGGWCVYGANPATGDILWTSAERLSSLHWQSPILVDGALYISDGSHMNRFDINIVTHTVTPAAGPNGSIAPDTPQTVNDGATTSFTVTPNAHYEIANVTGCGGSLNGDTYTTGPITADCTVNASFSQIMHTVTPVAGTGGSIDPATPQPVGDGDTVQFTVTPSPGYLIDQVTGCDGALAGDVYTTAPVSADCTVSATFVVDNSDFIFSNGFDGAAP